MRRLLTLTAVSMFLISACVTINVYFPAAEVQKAAREFVEEVIGEKSTDPVDEGGGGAGMAVLSFFIGTAHAQDVDITIETPAIRAIQQRMEQRFQGTMRPHFDSGALGFTGDALVTVRDASKIPLNQRAAVNQAVADDNRDRAAVYREIAVANGHPEWEDRIRDTFASQWIASARAGWWYQGSGGAWQQK
ncbi:MAG TPA: YdbL family protein [Xanthomonadaceae bacterium]|nr:YdbL family protein [Xanthomonadaceae bacterium]